MADRSLVEKAERLLKLHVPGSPVVLANAWDAGTAKLIAAEGFAAIATTSAGVAFGHGVPDGEVLPRHDMLAALRRIAAAVSVPVSADVEAGYGIEPAAIAAMVRDLIAIGVAGANIQDRSPRHGVAPLALDLAVARIAAARKAADELGVPFVVNARTDAFHHGPWREPEAVFAEAVRRLNAYRAAGADCLFAPFAPLDAIARLAQALKGPLNMLRPDLSVTEMAAMGVARVSYGATLARAAFATVRRAAREIAERGTAEFRHDTIPNQDLMTLMSQGLPFAA